MSAPRFAPVTPRQEVEAYESPDHVPASWMPDRKAEVSGFQPSGRRLGYQGPDQGYALALANRYRKQIKVRKGETVEDAIRGTVAIALRRASIYGRGPVIHDIKLAFGIWAWLDEQIPEELAAARRTLFEGVGNVIHHYAESRDVADRVPESTLRLAPDEVVRRMPGDWRALTGS